MNNKEQTLLTKDLYENLYSDRKQEIVSLKEEQNIILTNKKEILKKLKEYKNELKLLKHNIKITKRAHKSEKRKLLKINKSLRFSTHIMMDLNNNFISEEENYINLNKYNVKKR